MQIHVSAIDNTQIVNAFILDVKWVNSMNVFCINVEKYYLEQHM